MVNGRANWVAPSFLSCGDDPKGILTGIKSNRRAGSPTGWAGLEFDSPGYSTDVDLAAGYSLTLGWDAVRAATGGTAASTSRGTAAATRTTATARSSGRSSSRTRRPRGAAGASPTARSCSPRISRPIGPGRPRRPARTSATPAASWSRRPGKPAVVTVELRSPYVMSRASGHGRRGRRGRGLRRRREDVHAGRPRRLLGRGRRATTRCLVRLTFRRPSPPSRLEAVVQCNRGSLPYLAPGQEPGDGGGGRPGGVGRQPAGRHLRLPPRLTGPSPTRSCPTSGPRSAGPTTPPGRGTRGGPKGVRRQGPAGRRSTSTCRPRRGSTRSTRGWCSSAGKSSPPGRARPCRRGRGEPAVGPGRRVQELPNPFAVGTDQAAGRGPAADDHPDVSPGPAAWCRRTASRRRPLPEVEGRRHLGPPGRGRPRGACPRRRSRGGRPARLPRRPRARQGGDEGRRDPPDRPVRAGQAVRPQAASASRPGRPSSPRSRPPATTPRPRRSPST